MNEVWMLDYLHAVFPQWGVFESESDAWDWVEEHDSEEKAYYKPFMLTVNVSNDWKVPTTAPERKYCVQR